MEDACTKGPRRWNWFIVGLLALALGVFALFYHKILADTYSSNLRSDSHDYSTGRLPLRGFEAFAHNHKRAAEANTRETWGIVGASGVLLGLALLCVGLTRSAPETNDSDVERFPCPECGELIAVTARVCRFCSAMLLPQERPRRRFGK
jgi:hypothetical protein